MINLENFDMLLPKFHLRGIIFLIETVYFLTMMKALKKAKDAAKGFGTSLATTYPMNANRNA